MKRGELLGDVASVLLIASAFGWLVPLGTVLIGPRMPGAGWLVPGAWLVIVCGPPASLILGGLSWIMKGKAHRGENDWVLVAASGLFTALVLGTLFFAMT